MPTWTPGIIGQVCFGCDHDLAGHEAGAVCSECGARAPAEELVIRGPVVDEEVVGKAKLPWGWPPAMQDRRIHVRAEGSGVRSALRRKFYEWQLGDSVTVRQLNGWTCLDVWHGMLPLVRNDVCFRGEAAKELHERIVGILGSGDGSRPAVRLVVAV